MDIGNVVAIGWRAADILGDAAADVRVLASLRASIYIAAGGEILWLGALADLMHPRAILLSALPARRADADDPTLTIPARRPPPWRPETMSGGTAVALALRNGARHLAAAATTLGDPDGFGLRLMSKPLRFPLTGAAKAADALARACAADDAPAAVEPAMSLLGLGAGLTPSGDDFVGGAFFARAVLAQLAAADAAAWSQAATAVRAAAREATTPISATLLGDLLAGHGWSPLHELACALTVDDLACAVNAAARLTRLGHSSGWDVLAGFIAGVA